MPPKKRKRVPSGYGKRLKQPIRDIVVKTNNTGGVLSPYNRAYYALGNPPDKKRGSAARGNSEWEIDDGSPGGGKKPPSMRRTKKKRRTK